MNTIFENICTYSLDNIKEMKKATMKKFFTIFTLTTATILLFAGMVFQASTVLSQNAGVIFYCGAVYFYWLYFSFCRKNAKKIYKHNNELYGEEVQTRIQFKDNDIIANNFQSGVEVRLDYDQVESVIESKNLYLVMVENNMIMILDKGGFTENCKEKPEYFKTFLSDKIDDDKLHFSKFNI